MPLVLQHILQAQQSFGASVAAEKIPTWHACKNIQYPQRLSLEQCSSEWTARYKATLVSGSTLVDLTGGMGVDCSFLSDAFAQTTYVEQSTQLCQLAQNNFSALHKTIRVINDTCEHYLLDMPTVDVIFIDPARRDQKGGKMVGLASCSPNLLEIGALLLQKCQTLLIKLSPMIDIEAVVNVFPTTTAIHIVSVKNECKEVLLKVESQPTAPTEPVLHCINLLPGQSTYTPFCFTRAQERSCTVSYAAPLTYLYEPNASILKAGAFKQVAVHYGVQKLHPNSHLYTSTTLAADFPGKIFSIERITKVQRKEITDIEKGNLVIRNFPGSVADLRKKLKLKDGGDTHIFATTLCDDSKVLIVGRRVRS